MPVRSTADTAPGFSSADAEQFALKLFGREGRAKALPSERDQNFLIEIGKDRRFVQNPIYAGINVEKWTEEKPVKGKFEGLVSIKLFNKANRGKVVIAEQNGEITIHKDKPPDYLLNKQVKNPLFPYKRHVM
ncbi:MAG: hypothetical protein KKD59_05495, partial [Acidobacteria bacterium]|nr:hypothetical protein [Acidobacteriota bacterium]